MPRDSNDRRLPARARRSDLSLNGDDEPPRRDGSLFIWAVIILLLIGFALACWIGSFYIFGHPEKAFSYSILTKLKKLDPPKRFEITAAPRGEFLNAKQLLERYSVMTPRELDRLNESLLRNYLRNYKLTQDVVPYVVGSYSILDSYELTDKNLFTTGIAVLARSKDVPQVVLEQIFPTTKESVHQTQRMLLTGVNVEIRKMEELSAVLHVAKLPDGGVQVTTIPILYGGYAPTDIPGSFSLEPPTRLNLEAPLPVLNAGTVGEARKKFASFLAKTGQADPAGEGATPGAPQLMRVARPQTISGQSAPSPTPDATPAPLPSASPALAGTLPPEPSPTPQASPSPVLEPFITPTPAPAIASTSGGSWPTYTAGQMPRGRLLNLPDTQELAGRGVAGERIYLQGNFIVTASGGNRAVLRSQNALGENLGLGGRTTKTRVIVEFPSGAAPPSEGSTFSRDSRRPFLITDVRKDREGQVNVYVREITKP